MGVVPAGIVQDMEDHVAAHSGDDNIIHLCRIQPVESVAQAQRRLVQQPAAFQRLPCRFQRHLMNVAGIAKGGGAIYLKESALTGNGLTMNANEAGSHGGAIYTYTGATADIDNITATDNKAGSSSNGGFLYITQSSVIIRGGSASGNSAKKGATIYGSATATLALPATGFDYPAGSIEGASGFTQTDIPSGDN